MCVPFTAEAVVTGLPKELGQIGLASSQSLQLPLQTLVLTSSYWHSARVGQGLEWRGLGCSTRSLSVGQRHGSFWCTAGIRTRDCRGLAASKIDALSTEL